MADMEGMEGYEFTYNPGPAPGAPAGRPTQLFAWQVAVALPGENAIEDADDYADYAINRDRVTQALGLGMAQGRNAFSLGDQLFVAAVSVQNEDGGIELVNESYPRYADVAVVVAERLLRGEDHGMVAQLPNGNLVPFLPPTDAADL